jgi:ABC-type nitrate/sulfonate/bicarbonate transport system permease component
VKRSVLRNVGIPLLSLAVLLGLWQAIVVVFNVAPYIMPRPFDAIRAVTDNWSLLWPLILGTIRETVYGFVCGALLGLGLGVIMAKVSFLQKFLYPLLVLSQAVPIIALAPPLVLILGFGIAPKVFIVIWVVFFPVAVNVFDGLTHVDQDLVNLARVYGASRRRTFLQIEIPASTTPIFSGLKIGAIVARALPGARELQSQRRRGLRHDDGDDGLGHQLVPSRGGYRSTRDAVAASQRRTKAAVSSTH